MSIEIRKATYRDVAEIVKIYEAAAEATPPMGWVKRVYPTEEDASDALSQGTLYVMTDAERVAATAIINQKQVDVYGKCPWIYEAENGEVLVLHTLAVSPEFRGRGYGSAFVRFYEDEARRRCCKVLRMDTNAVNTPARALYKKLGYREAGIIPCTFNGIDSVELVCLEKKV